MAQFYGVQTHDERDHKAKQAAIHRSRAPAQGCNCSSSRLACAAAMIDANREEEEEEGATAAAAAPVVGGGAAAGPVAAASAALNDDGPTLSGAAAG